MGVLWTTRDGRQLPVEEMSDRHLINTIRMLERVAVRRHYDTAEALDIDFAQSRDDHVFPVVPGPPFADMVAECRARGGAIRRRAEDVWDHVHCTGWDQVPWKERRRLYREGPPREAVPGLDPGGPEPYPTKRRVRPCCAMCDPE